MTSDLMARLRAQIDEDAALIDGLEYWANYIESTELDGSAAEAAYLRRVRAEVEAKRRILDWSEQMREWANDNNLWSYDETAILKLLALPLPSEVTQTADPDQGNPSPHSAG